MHRSEGRSARFSRSAPFSPLGATALVCLALLGCASAVVLTPVPLPEAGRLASTLELEAALDAPQQLVFDWSMTEPGARLRGRGVARVDAPYRARLDLFLSNMERVAVAALVGDDRSVLQGGRAELPPTPMLWGALGVFRPGPGAILREARSGPDGSTELIYRLADSQVVYRVERGRIESVEVSRGGRVREELRLVRSDETTFPTHAVYRDLDAVRELTITLESVEDAAPFSPETWDPTS